MQTRVFKVVPLGVNSDFRFWDQGITPLYAEGNRCLSVGC
jgi:hypothetical protein